MRSTFYIFLFIVIMVFAGCAHTIAISPDISKIERDNNLMPIEKNVGYYIAPDIREKNVTTPGGGGDSVSYFPYKDIETGFYKMLGNVFKEVTKLKSTKDLDAISRRSIVYIITLEISTDSSSSSSFTWPPTHFIVNLTCNITDKDGNFIIKPTVTGEGLAEYDEFKTDFSLAGKRASRDALLKMQSILLGSPELRNP
jgi:hypothetical protein